jgi:xylulose-5-phosphate/fructose-6-phosphate phosphoketolase
MEPRTLTPPGHDAGPDVTVRNDLDRFHLVMNVIDRVPRAGDRGTYLKQWLKGEPIEHRQYITRYGPDPPEVRNWEWESSR